MNSDSILFFDGICNLCNGTVDFVIQRDNGYFKFASLQSDFTKLNYPQLYSLKNPESIVLYENGQTYVRSTAALKVASHLQSPWSFLKFFLIIPAPLRDLIYKWVARNRYRWFGKRETCRLPTPQERNRILG